MKKIFKASFVLLLLIFIVSSSLIFALNKANKAIDVQEEEFKKDNGTYKFNNIYDFSDEYKEAKSKGLNYYAIDLDTGEAINEDFYLFEDAANNDISFLYNDLNYSNTNIMDFYLPSEESLEEHLSLSEFVYNSFFVKTIERDSGKKFLILKEKEKKDKILQDENLKNKLIGCSIFSGIFVSIISAYVLIINDKAFKRVSSLFNFVWKLIYSLFKIIYTIICFPIRIIASICNYISEAHKESKEVRRKEQEKIDKKIINEKERELTAKIQEQKRKDDAKRKEEAAKNRKIFDEKEMKRRNDILKKQQEQIETYKKEIEVLEKKLGKSDITLKYSKSMLPTDILNLIESAEKLYAIANYSDKNDFSPEVTAYTNLVELIIKSINPKYKKRQLGLNDSIKALIADNDVSPYVRNSLKELQIELTNNKIIYIRNKASHYEKVSFYELQKVRTFLFESIWKKVCKFNRLLW